MLNKSNNSLKQREDAGWAKVHQQLDLELPVKKDKDRKILWILLFAGMAGAGFLWNQKSQILFPHNQVRGEEKKSGPKSENLQNLPEVLSAPVVEKPLAKIIPNYSSAPSITDQTKNRLGSQNYLEASVQPEVKNRPVPHKKARVNSTPELSKQESPARSSIRSSNIAPIHVAIEKASELTNENASKQAFHSGQESNPISTSVLNPGLHDLPKDIAPMTRNLYSFSKLPFLLTELEYRSMLQLPEMHEIKGSDLTEGLKIPRRSGFLLQGAATLVGTNYFVSSFSSGASVSLGHRWAVHGLVGLGYQSSNKKKSILAGNASAQSSANSGKVLDASNSVNYNQAPEKIFLDRSNGMTRFVNGNLLISNADQVLYSQKNHFNIEGQASIAYSLSPKWYVESGLFFHKPLTKEVNQLLIISNNTNLSSTPVSNLNNIVDIRSESNPIRWHGLILLGYKINSRWDGNLGFGTQAFSSTLFSSNNSPVNDPGSSLPSSTSSLILPDLDGSGFGTIRLRYRF